MRKIDCLEFKRQDFLYSSVKSLPLIRVDGYISGAIKMKEKHDEVRREMEIIRNKLAVR